MKLRCHKCKKELTESLVYVPLKIADFKGERVLFNKSSIFDYFGDNDDYLDRKMKSGIFYIRKEVKAYNHRYSDEDPSIIVRRQKPMIVVGKKSVAKGVIPKFKQGYGCCNYSLGEPLYCDCGVELGDMHLDCYEDEYVAFNSGKVDRCY